MTMSKKNKKKVAVALWAFFVAAILLVVVFGALDTNTGTSSDETSEHTKDEVEKQIADNLETLDDSKPNNGQTIKTDDYRIQVSGNSFFGKNNSLTPEKPSSDTKTQQEADTPSSDTESQEPVNPTDPTEPTDPVEPVNPVDPTPTIEEQNDALRTAITNKYSVNVASLEDTRNVDKVANYYVPSCIDSEEKMQIALKSLDTSLSRYPNNFFQTITNSGMPLTIYLFNSVGGSTNSRIWGMTENHGDNKIKLSVNVRSTGALNDYMLDHELMHYIDQYLTKIGGKNIETEYIALNAPEFKYEENAQWSYHSQDPKDLDTAFTVSEYGGTNFKEDRAELFRYMMLATKQPFFVDGAPLNNKAKLIAEQIESMFGAGDYPWEKHIAN